jgi:signal peptidase II
MVGLALLVVLLDQASKAWISTNMISHDIRIIIEGFLRLRPIENTGAAFGIFQGGTVALSIAAAAIIAALVLSASRLVNNHPFLLLSMGLVLGGAFGNLTDRVRLGYVVDFIEVYRPNIKLGDTIYTFPVFNVADSAITVGVILIMAILTFSGDVTAPAPERAKVQPPEEQPSTPVRSE